MENNLLEKIEITVTSDGKEIRIRLNDPEHTRAAHAIAVGIADMLCDEWGENPKVKKL